MTTSVQVAGSVREVVLSTTPSVQVAGLVREVLVPGPLFINTGAAHGPITDVAFPPKDRRVAVHSQAWVTGLGPGYINNATLPVGASYLPHRFFPRDRRASVSAQDWVRGSGAVFLGTATAVAPVGSRASVAAFRPRDRRVAINAQQWVLPASVLNVSRNAVLPPGTQVLPHRYLLKDRRVAINALGWVRNRAILELLPPTAATLPPGLQYYPHTFRRKNALVAYYSQHWMNFPSHSQKGHVHKWQQTGVFNAVGTAGNLAVVATFGGAGSAVFTGKATSSAAFSMAATGRITAAGVAISPSILSALGHVSLSAVSASGTNATALWAGSGAFNTSVVTTNGLATMQGAGTFSAKGTSSNSIPFNYPPSWSIMIYGPIIEGVGFDPTTGNLRIWYTDTDGQFITLQNFTYSITNQIELAPNPEAYVLGLIKSRG